MSQVPFVPGGCVPQSAASSRPRGVRQQGKAQSRLKLLEAARSLFIERGYEAATMREIAAAAGLSTGAVFASFTDKVDLFSHVMDLDDRAQLEAMRSAGAAGGPVEARLVGLLSAAAGYQLRQPRLLCAAQAAGWSNGGSPQARPAARQAVDLLIEALQDAVASGEVRRDADVGLIAETLWDCLLQDLRRALNSGAGPGELAERTARQVRLMMAGQRAT